MINLLPPELHEDYRYARRNRILLRWIIIGGLGLAGAVIISVLGLLYLRQTTNDYTSQVTSTTSQLKTQDIAGVQKQVTDISNNLQLVVKVLSKEVLFSQVLKQLGAITPSNVILTNLTILQGQNGIDITAQTSDYNAATQLQINLADPKNQIFAKADIVNISCGSGTNKQYPCTATLRAQFAANNPFLFINTKASAS